LSAKPKPPEPAPPATDGKMDLDRKAFSLLVRNALCSTPPCAVKRQQLPPTTSAQKQVQHCQPRKKTKTSFQTPAQSTIDTVNGDKENDDSQKQLTDNLVEEGLGSLDVFMGSRGAHGPEPNLLPTQPHERRPNSVAPVSLHESTVALADALPFPQTTFEHAPALIVKLRKTLVTNTPETAPPA